MKKQFIYTLIILALTLASCGDFLKEYSQDLVVPKTPTDLDEILVGGVDGYLPSIDLTDNSGDYRDVTGRWFNILDDDINTVVTKVARNWLPMQNMFFGYTTWQWEVGRNLAGNYLANDDQVWNDLYHRINSANVMLKQLEQMTVTTDKDRQIATRVKGECYFLRGAFYFTLANLYGAAYSPLTADVTLTVPIKLTEYVEYDKTKEVQFPRATAAAAYKQIVSDLTQAADLLTESPQTRPLHRASKEAATLLLSRVYLYMQDWENAKKTAEKFLEMKNELQNYAGLTEAGIAVAETSPEIVFSQGSFAMQGRYNGEGGDFCISKDLYDTYTDNDYRKKVFFKKGTGSDSIALGRKYRNEILRLHVSDVFTLRTAEAYLNAAEAAAMTGAEGVVLKYLNALRSFRYETPNTITLAGEELINEIRAERRRELCIEGHRWFDLRRYAAAEKYPMKKEIIRTFAIYDYENKLQFRTVKRYKLEIDDPAYVFLIPKSLMDKEPKQIQNKRTKREPMVENE